MNDIKWVEIESWHIVESSGLNANGVPTVRTRCGLERTPWSGDFLDRLPGGGERSCENCLKYEVRDLDAPAKAKATKGPRKTK